MRRAIADDERVKVILEKSPYKTFSRKRKGTGHGGTIK